MSVPRIDPNVMYVGVSELRKLNAARLRTLEGALVIQDNGEPLVIVLPLDTFLRMQSKLTEEGAEQFADRSTGRKGD